MMKNGKTRVMSRGVAIALACVLILGTFTQAFAIPSKKQTSWCLDPSAFTSVVKNKKMTVKAYTYGYGSASKKNTIKTSKSDKKSVTFTTKYLFPCKYQSNQWRNPQSMALDSKGRFLYVLYTVQKGSNTGWVVRYDMKKLDEYGITFSQLATATKGGSSALNQKLKSCIKVGKSFTTGHGQSLSYNPATDELWEIQDTNMKQAAGSYATVQRINKSTLEPDAKITFRLKTTVSMGHNMTSDKDGNAYFYTYAGSGEWAGSVKIYKGQISTSRVHFELIPQGLRFNAGTHSQGMGYSAKSNRLVFIADGSIQSVPVDKLGHLKPSDVWQTNFNTKREFESMVFDAKGYGYLLSNRDPEILKTTKVY